MTVLQCRKGLLVSGIVPLLVLAGLGVKLHLVEEHCPELNGGGDIQSRLSGLLADAGLDDCQLLPELLPVGGQHVSVNPYAAVLHVGENPDQRHLYIVVYLFNGGVPGKFP